MVTAAKTPFALGSQRRNTTQLSEPAGPLYKDELMEPSSRYAKILFGNLIRKGISEICSRILIGACAMPIAVPTVNVFISK